MTDLDYHLFIIRLSISNQVIAYLHKHHHLDLQGSFLNDLIPKASVTGFVVASIYVLGSKLTLVIHSCLTREH